MEVPTRPGLAIEMALKKYSEMYGHLPDKIKNLTLIRKET